MWHVAKDAYNIPTSAELTTQTCKKLISKQFQSAWKQRSDRSEVARWTYDLLPLVGKKLVFPSDLCCAISYVRLLLNDSAVLWRLINTRLAWSSLEYVNVAMVLKTLITSSLNAQYMNTHDIFWRANCSWAGKKVVMMETLSFLFSLF